jgi:death-on-curing family protein
MLIPTFDIIVETHDVVLEVSGGRPGIHVKSDILRAVERPETYVHYVETFDVDTICAVLIDSIARYHGFNDGNKRTALMIAIFTYRINGVHFKATTAMNKKFDALVMWVVEKKPSISEIEKRLKIARKSFEVDTEQSLVNMFVAFVTMRRLKEAAKKAKS